MRLLVERSGGFAGIRKRAAVDSASLSPKESAELTELLNSSRIFDLPATPHVTPPGADQFQYRLTLETPERQRTVEISDPSSPEVRRLLDWVWARTQPC
jgi:hypothetical protein